MGGEFGGEWIHVYVWLRSFAVCLKLSQHCESAIPQYKKRPWWWERLRAGAERDDRGWDGWMASLTQRTWLLEHSRRWWKTGKIGMLQSMGSQSWMWLSNWTIAAIQNKRLKKKSSSFVPAAELNTFGKLSHLIAVLFKRYALSPSVLPMGRLKLRDVNYFSPTHMVCK